MGPSLQPRLKFILGARPGQSKGRGDERPRPALHSPRHPSEGWHPSRSPRTLPPSLKRFQASTRRALDFRENVHYLFQPEMTRLGADH